MTTEALQRGVYADEGNTGIFLVTEAGSCWLVSSVDWSDDPVRGWPSPKEYDTLPDGYEFCEWSYFTAEERADYEALLRELEEEDAD